MAATNAPKKRKKENLTAQVPREVDVRAIREDLELTQQQFARRYGFSVGAVRNWEQGIRQPEKAARLLLLLIRDERQAVERLIRKLAED